MQPIPYYKIASCLEEARTASRSQRQEIVAGFLTTIPVDIICPIVRLLTGELWPPWEGREMGAGPQMVSLALEELTSEDVGILRTILGDMGLVAEKALQSKSQHPLSMEPLDAMDVYGSLLRVSKHTGPSSECRKESILRGLFLNASPLEARYIARTLSRNTACGLGPQTMISALARAFNLEAELIRETHSRMPDLGALALACSKGRQELQSIRIKPGIPVRPMIIPPGEGAFPEKYLARYPGLHVQVHISSSGFSVYTMSLKEISPALQVLEGQLSGIGRLLIAEADLVCFQDGRMLCQSEVVRYVSREHNSRRLSTFPALIAGDLILLDGMDVTGLAYSQRRQKLQSVLGPVMPEPGIYLAEEMLLEDAHSVLTMCRERGFAGFARRSPDEFYMPGKVSTSDIAIKATEVISAVIMGIQYDEGLIISSCLLALKNGPGYVPVGWAPLGSEMREDIEEMVRRQAADAESLEISPQAVVRVKISGVRCKDGQWHLMRPRIIEAVHEATPEEADDLEKLRPVMER